MMSQSHTYIAGQAILPCDFSNCGKEKRTVQYKPDFVSFRADY